MKRSHALAALSAAGACTALTATLLLLHLRAHGAATTLRDAHPFVEVHAPRVERPIVIDAEEGKKVWESDVGGTGVLRDATGVGMVPYSEGRVRWGDGVLYLWLYAGDLDIEAKVATPDGPVAHDDSFHVELGSKENVYTIDVSALGTLADSKCDGAVGATSRRCDAAWQSGAKVAVDRDGTVNHTGDNDEEWIVEMAIPFASIGIDHAAAGVRIPFGMRRCEMTAAGPRACGSFGLDTAKGEIVLEAHAIEESATAAAR